MSSPNAPTQPDTFTSGPNRRSLENTLDILSATRNMRGPTVHDIAAQLAASKRDVQRLRNSILSGEILSPSEMEELLTSNAETWSGPPEYWLVEDAHFEEVDGDKDRFNDADIPDPSGPTEPFLIQAYEQTSPERGISAAELDPSSDNEPAPSTASSQPTAAAHPRTSTSMRRAAAPAPPPTQSAPTDDPAPRSWAHVAGKGHEELLRLEARAAEKTPRGMVVLRPRGAEGCDGGAEAEARV